MVQEPTGLTAALAELSVTAQPGRAARDRALLLLADYLAVAGAGAATGSARAAREALLTSVDHPGPAAPAVVLGTGRYAPVRDAALVNGISAHSLELDDTHEPSSSHPGTVIWTALLAAAATRPATMRSLLEAGVAGYQVMASLGELLRPDRLYRQGLHPTAICGVFGAAAAVSRLAGLDAAGTRQAFGIALSLSAGSMAYLSEGAWTKRLHSGSAAAGGILAAELAAGSFAGPVSAFEDPNGLLHIHGAADGPSRIAEVLAHAAGLPAVHETSIKFHPCCRYLHGVMDLLAGYRREGGRIEGLTSIDCGVLSGGMGLVAEPLARKRQVTSMVGAQFSLPFAAALALATGSSSVADFRDAAALAPRLQPLMDLVGVHTSPELEAGYPARWGAEVTLRFGRGEPVELRTAAFRGSPGWPAGRDEIAAKAAGLIGGRAAGELLDTLAGGTAGRLDPGCLTRPVCQAVGPAS